MAIYKSLFKPTADVLVASIGFIVTLPVFVLLTVTLFFTNHGSPFFFQIRPGKHGKLFKIAKFKTMNDKKDANRNLLPDAQRLTTLGIVIRKTSLDEIPQLINVIFGQMSLVGPRPLLPEYLGIYNNHQSKRHDVRPGITGWAQVNGRNAISWEQKLELDVWYVENQSLLLDIKILLRTVKKVINSEGINTEDEVTSTRFTGTKQ